MQMSLLSATAAVIATQQTMGAKSLAAPCKVSRRCSFSNMLLWILYLVVAHRM